MRIVRGNYSFPRVGHVETLKAGIPGAPFFVGGPEYIASEADAERWGLDEGKAYRDWAFPGYPIRITEDTEFRETNFAQESPHTAIFDVVPQGLVNPVLRLVECNLTNVTVPDGAEIVGGNLAQVVRTETGNPERPFVNLLCECPKCPPAVMEIRDIIAEKDPECFDEHGRFLHHRVKERVRVRRDFEALVEADVLDIQNENDAALAKWGR